jgi:hypothetical protein
MSKQPLDFSDQTELIPDEVPATQSRFVTDAQIWAAADAMQALWETSDDVRRVGISAWWHLAKLALEVAATLDGKAVSPAPQRIQ